VHRRNGSGGGMLREGVVEREETERRRQRAAAFRSTLINQLQLVRLLPAERQL
jgi:hypothetical protein